MRPITAFVTAAVVALSCAFVIAQAAPNFAGKWTLIPDPAAAQGPGFGGLGAEATIVQDAKTITIARPGFGGESMKTTHNLDGSDTKNSLSFNGNAFDQMSKVKIDGGKLTITTKFDGPNGPIESSMALSLDASGNMLVESTSPDFQGGGAPTTRKMSYKKN
jgi:hypothetical protein